MSSARHVPPPLVGSFRDLSSFVRFLRDLSSALFSSLIFNPWDQFSKAQSVFCFYADDLQIYLPMTTNESAVFAKLGHLLLHCRCEAVAGSELFTLKRR